MSFTLLALFVPACFALNLSPGPNNLLAFSNASRLGFVPAVLGGFGRLPIFAAMIALVALGLSVLLTTFETALIAVKYLGAAYLIYVGYRMWTAPVPDETVSGQTSVLALMRRDMSFAIANPKAIAVFTAFFPQFIDQTGNLLMQFALLGALFLMLEVVAIAVYAGCGHMMSQVLTPIRLHRLNRGVGGFLIFSGLTMALKPES
ncbi:Homoserine/homoserine lactone efflux protein [Pelagimonas phthalicica]|uniref:Homoserine/homoserine lactone efflux protein n=1 Tax=Pelagimonas phthalicica TaxID=1037362 RepID=A0A238JAH1_9RHOB|nr:LysE family translocator [Pelagimonas phthalicica]TDS94606.1 threonine/homoserine/homoserine lactone efflux protein [Pelagimonas phthalicica]SMX26866.1 Homoserine/homoserine lactone efflux protein [Pelagimonas phthalicica]